MPYKRRIFTTGPCTRIRQIALLCWMLLGAGVVSPASGQQGMQPVMSYERYRTPSACLNAARREDKLYWRARRLDTASPATRDRWSEPALQAGRSCGQRFTSDSIPSYELPPFVDLALLVGDNAGAQRAGERYVRGVAKNQKPWAIYRITTAFLNAKSVRLDAALSWIERLDSLGTPAIAERIRAYAHFVKIASLRNDTLRIRIGVQRGLSLIQTVGKDDWAEWADEFMRLNYLSSHLVLSGPGGATEAIALLQPVAAKLEPIRPDKANALKNVISWYRMFGTPAERLQGARWANVPPGDTVRPTPGKVSLVIFGSHMCQELCYPAYSSIRRLLKRLPAGNVSATLVVRAYGMFRLRGAPMPIDEEFQNIKTQYLETIGLPTGLLVVEATMSKIADGRFMQQSSAAEQQYGQASGALYPVGILVDRDGNIRMVEFIGPETELFWESILGELQ